MHPHHGLTVPVVGLTLFAILPWPIALPIYLIAAALALVFWRKGLEAVASQVFCAGRREQTVEFSEFLRELSRNFRTKAALVAWFLRQRNNDGLLYHC